MNLREQILQHGFVILKNIFSKNELLECQNEIIEFIKNNKTLKNSGGISIPDFINKNEFSKTSSLKNNLKIQKILKDIFNGENFRFCSHNDIGINRICPWHKDKLNGKYSKYETVDIWSSYEGEKHEIVKVLIYLENHDLNNDGLKLVPGSHLIRKINQKGNIQLKPELGDVIVFDQRITHRGMAKQVKYPRILVSFGFGKNNIFTDNFEKGTIMRQNNQNKIL